MSRDLLLNLALKRAGRDGQGEKGSKRGERWEISRGEKVNLEILDTEKNAEKSGE